MSCLKIVFSQKANYVVEKELIQSQVILDIVSHADINSDSTTKCLSILDF